MTSPLLSVLGVIPQAVLAGLFFVMGLQALEGNGITLKIVFLLQDKVLTPVTHPLKKCRLKAVWGFVGLELLGFGATFAITQTIAAVGFPIVVVALVPLRMYLLPRWFRKEELIRLDQATASKFTLESVGGAWGGSGDDGDKDDDEEEQDIEMTRVPSAGGSAAGDVSGGARSSTVSSQSLTIQAIGQQSDPRLAIVGGGESEEDVLEKGEGRGLKHRRKSEIARWSGERGRATGADGDV